jgi:galactokinase
MICEQTARLNGCRLTGPMATAAAEPADACDWFVQRYGYEPDGAWFAPGRVNLIGGPDYNEVLVLPFAVGAGVSAAASRRSDDQIIVSSRQAGREPVSLRIDELEPGSADGWAAYPAGVAWALREAGHLAGGADVAVDADLPAGAGLASSAALACAVALALTGVHQQPVPGPELAKLARRAENDFAGVPSGAMDQLAVLLCRAGQALLLDCRTLTHEAVPLNPAAAGLELLVIDTRARRSLTDGRYAERRRACLDAAAALGVGSLREMTGDPDAPARLTDPVVRRAAGHVISEFQRAVTAAEMLRSGDVPRLGGLLTASHQSLRDEFEVSWPEADAAVEAAMHAGALGARMTGGGFGGCVIVLVTADGAAGVRDAVTGRFARRGWPDPRYLEAVPSDGARRIR